ncbi:AraC family transcriptional regulator [Actinoplanes sp. NPDC026619]|uniref:AraC family transcriptional regulator n=1 Tax=Actinoplanes sp. NPDC026619 TaxID=3155798 RepID=UPI0033D2CF75
MSVQHADPLEDVLALVGTTSRLSTGLVAGGDWALDFDPPPAVKFNALRRGSCLLIVDGITYPLAAGDCFLLTRSTRFVLASSPAVVPSPAAPVFAAAGPDGIARTGAGDDVFLLGGRFDFGARARELLLDALPPVLHVPGGTPAAATLRWALDQIDTELRDHPIASGLVAEHLALVMLIHILRLHLASAPPGQGWLGGLADPVVAPALRAMHADPARAWTVADLAAVSTVSRSTLAARFRQAVGQGPLDYLTGWRIELAAARLRRGDGTLSTIARAVGYGSESALSTAFKRVTGESPRQFRAPRSS